MNIASLLAAAAKVQTLLPSIENAGVVFTQFITSGITAVEQTGLTGEEKLAAVLNATETAFKGLGNEALEVSFEELAPAVETAVNDVVAVWNAAGVFVHAIVGAAEAVKGAL